MEVSSYFRRQGGKGRNSMKTTAKLHLPTPENVLPIRAKKISELYDLQDQLEQYTRKNSLEIHRIPKSAYSLTEEVVLRLADALKVPV